MWILPNNHPLSSRFAQEYADSKEDLKEYFEASELPLMWKSKPLSWKTFCLQWKRVWWMQHLSGRILKPSTRTRFEIELMGSLEAIPASLSVLPVTGGGIQIQDTFTRILNQELAQLDLFGVSSKMSPVTSQWDTPKFQKAFERWVTELRAESTLRKKLAQHMRESVFSSLPSWPTPTAMVCEEDLEKFYVRQKRMKLRHAGRTGNGIGMNIGTAVQKWATPTARDYRSPFAENSKAFIKRMDHSRGVNLVEQIQRNSHLVKDSTNGTGKNRARLNPAWTLQLMGTTLAKIFTVPLAIQLLNKPQK